MHVKSIHATFYDKFHVNSTTIYESLQQHIIVSMDIHYAKQFQIGNFAYKKEKNWIRLMMLDHDKLGKM
jgi:hypothetical protein